MFNTRVLKQIQRCSVLGGERKLIVKHPDGRVIETHITDEEFHEMVLGKMSSGMGRVRTMPSHSKRKRTEDSSDVFPTDEQLQAVLKDGDKSVNELAEHFFKRKINAHKEERLWHRLYGARKRVQERMKAQ
jgi:hypothetical protein